MNITDPTMAKRMLKALNAGDALFSWDDVSSMLKSGKMQGHVEGDTWAITQVHDWPQRKSVNILYIVGNLEDTAKLEAKVTVWAKELGADLLTATGRDGWSKLQPGSGWKKIGTLYSKDI